MLLGSASQQLDSDLTAYGICIFLITFGLFFYFYFSNKLVYIGMPFTFFGFLFLSVQLNINGYNEQALFVVGLTFLVTQFYWKSEENKLLMIPSFFFLSLAITFFCVAGLYMFYEGGQNLSLSSLVYEFVSFAAAIIAIIELVRKVIKYKSKE